MKSMARALPVLLLAAASATALAQEAKNCVSGTVELTGALAPQIPSGGTLFVRFTLCGEDQMIRGDALKALTAKYRAYARHSLTGKPMAQEGYLGVSTGEGKAGVRAGEAVTITIERPLGKQR
jgi:hypothetical protein